jgi:hypothetical protein
MSTLQLSLAILGGLVLVAVVAYNAWNNHRNAPKRAQPQPEPAVPDPQEVRLEPSLDAALEDPPAWSAAPPPQRDPLEGSEPAPVAVAPASAAPAASAASAGPATPSAYERKLQLDPLLDAMASLLVESLVPGELAQAAMPPSRRAGSKPFTIEGFNAASQQWEVPQPGHRYMAFQAGVQLANRTGALTQIEFSEFVSKVQAFADAVNAAPEFPDMQHEVARARELDQFAMEHDLQISFVLRAQHSAWSPGYVQQCAARLGFVLAPQPGRMVLPNNLPGLPPLLSLSYDPLAAQAEDLNQSAVRDVGLSLDVPQVEREAQPYGRLREVAEALCKAMDGVLCNQEGQPLPTMALDAIVGDLELLYDQLDARELAAGSALARRLFS